MDSTTRWSPSFSSFYRNISRYYRESENPQTIEGHVRGESRAISEIVNSGIGRQPDGAALLSEGKLWTRYAVVYTGASGTLTRPQLP